MNSFERLCLVFFEEKKNINVSQATLEKYHKVIKPFLSFLNQKDIKTIDAINTLVFKEAIVFLLNGSKSIYTKKFVNNTVKMFLKFSFEHVGLSQLYDPFFNIKVVTPEIFPNIYLDETIEKILQTIELEKEKIKTKMFEKEDQEKETNRKREFFRLRAEVMLILLIRCGLKQEELGQLRLCDIELTEGERFYHVKVCRAKRGEREIPLRVHELRPLLERYRVLLVGENICSTFEGRVMQRREIENTIKLFMEELGLSFIGLQGFRHTYAKHLVEEGYAKESIRELMGYRNSSPVEKYIALFQNRDSNK